MKIDRMDSMPALLLDALQRINSILEEPATPEADARILAFKFDPRLQATLDDLADRANEGLLTNVERAEYLQFIDAMDLFAIRQIKAQRVLGLRRF